MQLTEPNFHKQLYDRANCDLPNSGWSGFDWKASLKETLENLTQKSIADIRSLGIAVSGGPDSMALLHGCHALMPQQIRAVTIDHQLRPESADEAAMVAQYCAQNAIDHIVLVPDKPITGNLQSQARNARYALFDNWRKSNNIDWIATAHHADDQRETLFMRMARGSGVAGLAGIRPRNGAIIRPILAVTKTQCTEYCHHHSVPFVEDPSNADARFDRVKMRAALKGFDAVPAIMAGQSAKAMADAEDALIWASDRAWHDASSKNDGVIMLDPKGYPHEILRRMVMRAITTIDSPSKPRGAALEQLIAKLSRGEQASMGKILCKGGAKWRFWSAPVRRTRQI